MKRFVAFLSILLGICFVFIFSGCSKNPTITLNSSIDINADESGSRTITANVKKEEIDTLIGSQNSSLIPFITACIPTDLISWNYTETSDFYDLTFTIEFQNLEEYQQKVGELTKVSDAVTITRPQIGVMTGFHLIESTEIISLFSWFTDALVERRGLSSSEAAAVLKNGTNQFFYTNIEFAQSDSHLNANVETLQNATQIDILTELSPSDEWNRTIRIFFPEDMLKNAENVKAYLTSLIDGLNIEESWENEVEWVLTLPTSSIAELSAIMGQIFHSENAAPLTEEISNASPMSFVHTYKEPLNLVFFVSAEYHTLLRYFVKVPESVSLYISDTEAKSLNDDYPGYFCLFHRAMTSGTLEFSAVYQYQPLEILSHTAIRSADDVRRTITFKFGNLLPLVHQERMLSAFKAYAAKNGTFSESTENDMYQIQYSLSGTPSEINEKTTALLGGTNTLSYVREKPSLFGKTISSSYQSTLDFQEFLPSPSHTLITDILSLPKGDLTKSEQNSLTVLTTDGISRQEGNAIRNNPLRFWMIVLLVLITLILLYFILIKSAKRRRFLKAAGKRQTASKRQAANSNIQRQRSSSKRPSSNVGSQGKKPAPKRQSSASSAQRTNKSKQAAQRQSHPPYKKNSASKSGSKNSRPTKTR